MAVVAGSLSHPAHMKLDTGLPIGAGLDISCGCMVMRTMTAPALMERRRQMKAPLRIPGDVSPVRNRLENPALAQFSLAETLGRGSSSMVIRAVRRSDEKQVALKKAFTDDEQHADIAKREVRLLQNLQHPNICKAFDFFASEGCTFSVLEFFDGQNLRGFVRQATAKHLGEGMASSLFLFLMDAVAYIHRKGILHRDIKPENVLIAQDGQALKLIDFNIACHEDDASELDIVGTPQYRAPEILLFEPFCKASDVWGVGLCGYFMLSGRLPQRREHISDDSEEFMQTLAAEHPSFSDRRWKSVSQASKDVLSACLAPSWQDRPTAEQALKDPWVQCGAASPTEAKCQMLPSGEAKAPVATEANEPKLVSDL